jgi:Ca2+:H+ antiporter
MASVRRNDWAAEWPLALAVVTLAAMLLSESVVAEMLDQPATLIGLLVLICGVILAAAMAIVRHAEILAHRLGEPAGTLLLTLAITGLEVAMVGFVMATGEEKPTLARDAIFGVVMLVFNGFLGISLVLGGLRHGEQKYNLFGANAFLIMILPLTVLGLVLPNYTRSTPGAMLSTFQMVFLSVMSVGIYAIFLFLQNQRHRGYFQFEEDGDEDAGAHEEQAESRRSTLHHSLMLVAYGLPLVMLAKQLSTPLEAMVSRLGAPVALGGLVLATLVLTPESIAAVKAAWENRLQRSVNILLGSVLAAIGLTIPLVIAISLATGRGLLLGLDPAEMVMLALTLATAGLTFALPRMNVLLGWVHLLLFGAYLMLMFD